jgi:hypothetical protein
MNDVIIFLFKAVLVGFMFWFTYGLYLLEQDRYEARKKGKPDPWKAYDEQDKDQ